MVGKSSPKLPLMGSPKLRKFLAPTGSTKKKKPSPKCNVPKKSAGKQRANWTAAQEKSLVEILHKYNSCGYRGDISWTSEVWNLIVKEFLEKNKNVSYSREQIQDKEGTLKRDYKMLKEARKQSGGTWNYERNMIEGSEAFWENLLVSWPKIKKFNNSKASFPLFDDLGELYDGRLAEGNLNVTSLGSPEHEELQHQLHDVEAEEEDQEQDLDNIMMHEIPDDDELDGRDVLLQDGESSAAAAQRSGQQKTTAAPKRKEEKEEKRPKKGARIEAMMAQYLEIKAKQTEAEAALLAKEREAKEREAKEREAKEKEVNLGSEYSIKRCITVVDGMEMSKPEKAKAYSVFIKSKENREAFISACQVDPEIALMWLRNEIG